jgi:hypothetical protein
MYVAEDKHLLAKFPIQIIINLINYIINHRVNITHVKCVLFTVLEQLGKHVESAYSTVAWHGSV